MMLRVVGRRVHRVIGENSLKLTLSRSIALVPSYSSALSSRGARFTPYSYQAVSYLSTSGPDQNEKKDEPQLKVNAYGQLESNKKSEKTKINLTVVVNGLKSVGNYVKDVVMNPRATWQSIKHELAHYWLGSKLLWSEIIITKNILGRLVEGHELTRRERKQLVRTTIDMFRLIPFAVFVIVPFMELLLPFCLKLFPNMLPSTFEDSLKKEETMKKELQMRLAVAKFMQETLQEIANRKADGASGAEKESGAKEILDFIDKAQSGQPLPAESILRIARLFKDELTLDNVARPQLVSMCTYMGLQSYGSDSLLRFLLRNKIRKLKEDDRRILWEGVDSLNTLELREACAERGMRSLGLTHFQLKHQLSEWLELSTHKNVPISLLIMSRALTLSHAHELPTAVVRSSLSSLDSDTINEVVLAAAKSSEEDSPDIRKRKLESLKFQQEKIDEERAKKDKKEAAAAAAAAAVVVESNAKAATAKLAEVVASGVEARVEESGKVAVSVPASDKPAVAAVKPQAATAAVAPEKAAQSVAPEAPKAKKELSLQEVQALVDLARGSSLQREKSELNILQSTIEVLLANSPSRSPVASDATSPVPADSAGAEPHADDVRLSRSVDRMRSVLNSMVKKLEVQIDSAEKEVGDKFNILDKDGDGQITAHELREAIVQLMRKEYSLQEADQMVDLLDEDKDGKVSLVELLHYIEQRKERLEVEALQQKVEQQPEEVVGSRLVNEPSK
eukprot:gene1858-2033_t